LHVKTNLYYRALNRPFFCFFLAVFCIVNAAIGQKTFTSEEDLKKEARKLFDNEQYTEAYPLYSQLLSVYPKDPNYNYRFGICMLYTSENKEKPISYLEYASKQPDVDKDVFYFLGKAYHLNYRFDDAIVAFNRFKKDASSYQIKKFQVDKQIDMCRNGKTLLKNITDLEVLEKKQISDKEFYKSYDLSTIGGKLLVKPDDFQSSLDKKAKEQTIIYLSKNNNQIYYSSYGTDGKNGKDIYMVKKLANGEWSTPQNLGSNINTESDEDYPFLHPNGKVLYFCSKGHNSMGGYDIFKSNWNEQTASWGPAENMDFSINTPDDDILYVTDSLEKTAYFSSRRYSPGGMIDVYKINTDRKPVDLALINGMVGKDPDGKFIKAKITVKNASSGELIGIFNSDPQTGQYSLNTPGGAKLVLTVESEGYKTQSEVVVLPQQQVFKPFRQEISYTDKTEVLTVKNFFDEAIDDNNYLLALNFIKEKAKMEISANESASKESGTVKVSVTKPDSTLNLQNSLTNSATPKPDGSISNSDLVKIAYDDAAEVQKEAAELKNQADQALGYANQKNQEAQAKYTDADAASRQGDQESAAELRKEGDRISHETVASFNLAKRLETDASNKRDEADLSVNYAKELETASKSNSNEALKQLEEQKKRIEELNQQPKGTANAYNSMKMDADLKQKELDRTKEESTSLKKEINGLLEQIVKINQDINGESNDQLKEGLKAQEKDLEIEKTKKESDLVVNDAKIGPLEKEAGNLKTEAELVNAVIGQIKPGTEPSVSISAVDKQKLQEQVNGYKMKDAPVVTGYENNYNGKLKEADAISDVYTRETTKSAYYKNWSDSINADVTAKKAQLNAISDEGKKKELEQKILLLLNESSQKKKLGEEAESRAKAVNSGVATAPPIATTNSAVSTNPAVSTTPAVSATSTPAISIQAVDTLAKPATPIVSATNTAPVTNTTPVATNTTPVANTPSVSIQSVDTLGKTKTTTPAVSATSNPAISIQSVDTLGKTKTTSPTVSATSTTPVTTTPVTTTPVTTTTVVTTGTTPVASLSNPIPFHSLQVKDTAKVIEDKKEAEDLNAQAISDRSEAYGKTDSAEVGQILQKAREIEVLAMKKQQSVSDEQQKSEMDNYNSNFSQLSVYAKAYENSTSDDVSRAEMMKDESKYYFDLAEKSRESARSATTYSSCQELLDKADENIAIASAKQAKAMQIYTNYKPAPGDLVKPVQSSKPQPTVTQPTATQPTVTQPTATQPTVTQPTATQPTATQPTATQPTATQPTATQPTATQPTVTQPTVTQPRATQPTATTQPTPAKPSSTQANANQPAPMQANGALSPQQLHQVQKTQEYEDYVALMFQSDSVLQIAHFEFSVSVAYHKQAEESNKKADLVSKQIDAIPEGQIVPDSLTSLASSYKEEARSYQQKSDSIHKLGEKAEDASKSKYAESELYIHSLDKNTSTNILLAYNGKVSTTPQKPTKPVANQNNAVASAKPAVKPSIKPTTKPVIKPITKPTAKPTENTAANTVASKTEGITLNGNVAYSKNHPIPIDAKLPDELHFRVQVGAFKNPIKQSLFNGITPLTGESTPSGVIRYTAGLFYDLNPAIAARDKIRNMGYRDAFVVAFYKGKRISYDDAMELLKNGKGNTISTSTKEPDHIVNGEQVAGNPVASGQVVAPKQPDQVEKPSVTQAEKPVVKPVQNTGTVQTTDIASVSGVVYTVQVGVYSKPVSPAQLFNLESIYTETMDNGLKRYTSGNYTTVDEAIKAKDRIVAKGIKDAFIIVYKDGKRMTGKGVAGNSAVVSTAPTGSTSVNKPQANDVKAKDVVFRIQIGSYSGEVPIAVANKFISVASKGVNISKDENGMTVYSVGTLKTYDEAVKLKDELVGSGLTDAFIVAYNKNKKMDLEEAKQLLNK